MRLNRDFFTSTPMDVARQLVGAYLCWRGAHGDIIRARICELELYMESERGCHAFGGKCTARNDAMFLPGGHTYVYLCYGLHNMLNIVVGRAGYGAAVLIRAVEYDGCNGPGKLTRRMGITRADNKIDLTQSDKIWVEARDHTPKIRTTPRIGIDYAGIDASLPWRFVIEDSNFISRP